MNAPTERHQNGIGAARPGPTSTLVTTLGAAVDALVSDHREAMFYAHHQRTTIRALIDFWHYAFAGNPEAIRLARRFEVSVTFRPSSATVLVLAPDVAPANRFAYEILW